MPLKVYIETTIPSFYFEARRNMGCIVRIHLANPNKFRHIGSINKRLGLPTPAVVTPLQLLGETL